MRSPDEIKKGLECCTNEDNAGCGDCPYDSGGRECGGMLSDALAYIQQLETERHQLLTKCERLERERDAAVAGLGLSRCDACKHKILDDSMQELFCMANDYDCNSCDAECRCKACNDGSCFEWRGVKEE